MKYIEDDVDDWVKEEFKRLNIKIGKDFYKKTAMSDFMKEALKGGAKTKNKTNFGIPDFSSDKYKAGKIAIVIENKNELKKLISTTKDGIKLDDKTIPNYAVNGAINYANVIIDNGKFEEVVAIGISGNPKGIPEIKVYLVYGSSEKSYKEIEKCTTLNFLESEESFEAFYNDAKLTEKDKQDILVRSRTDLQYYAKRLNKLMHNHNITAPQRVLYVSGMLLAMQEVRNKDGEKLEDGLIPDDLKGVQTETNRDGKKIISKIEEFLKQRDIPDEKMKLMLSSFQEISKDKQRDEETPLDKEVSTWLAGTTASTNKQIFTFIYENIFKSIDDRGTAHLDIMGELYSEFLKYALGDGKEIGIVLTPPYVTKMMTQMLNISYDSKVMDLATGSAGFLISSMELMIQKANDEFGKGTTAAKETIEDIKHNRLLGVELNAEMYTLATTNMILRKDGSSKIQKGSAFNRPEELFTEFQANRLLLNPPFSYEENGMPFIKFGLEKMEIGGLAAIIIQDSAGSGKAQATNKEILKHNQLKASIKMPTDLFQPMAGVQTSIYIFEHTGKEHNVKEPVKFIDFRNDGYKRTSRALQEIDEPKQRYIDIVEIYQSREVADVKAEWDIPEIFVWDKISLDGNDWNFDQHKKRDTKPTFDDFRKTVADYLAWEVDQLLKSEDFSGK